MNDILKKAMKRTEREGKKYLPDGSSERPDAIPKNESKRNDLINGLKIHKKNFTGYKPATKKSPTETKTKKSCTTQRALTNIKLCTIAVSIRQQIKSKSSELRCYNAYSTSVATQF
jgi:hypothetical protein